MYWRGDNHKMKLTAGFRIDISSWQSFMSIFNGKSLLLDRQHIQSVFTDSCTQAAGGIYEGDWFYIDWGLDWPLVSHLHFNSKEILATFLAVCRWAPCWRNKRIYIHSDNVTAVSAINKGTSKNPFVSSPEYEVLKVSYCDNPVSLVCASSAFMLFPSRSYSFATISMKLYQNV